MTQLGFGGEGAVGRWRSVFPLAESADDNVDPLLVLQWNEERSGAPIQQINYLKRISIAKHLITWNSEWMPQMCTFL